MTAGEDGNVWFTEIIGNAIGQITPDGTITEFPLFTPNTFPFGITLGPNGNFWFTERAVHGSDGINEIGQITPDGSSTELFPLPDPTNVPGDITVGPDGNLWFTEGNQIGQFVLDDGGGAPRSAPPARDTLVVNAAAVEARFVSAGQQVVNGIASRQPSTVAHIDAAFIASLSEAITVSTGPQVRTAGGMLPHLHQGDQPVVLDAAGLADPLTAVLES
jgi:sugar lactone lactonase YvrE